MRSYLFAESNVQTPTLAQLQAIKLPPSVAGYFLASSMPSAGVTPINSSGTLCLSGTIGRYATSVLNSGPEGTYSFPIDLSAISQPSGPVMGMPGETWYFQAWHRDSVAGSITSNFTNAVGITLP